MTSKSVALIPKMQSTRTATSRVIVLHIADLR